MTATVFKKPFRIAFLSLAIISLLGCSLFRSRPAPLPGVIDRDYYFADGQLQIQGVSVLPPINETIETIDQDGNTKTEQRFLGLAERRERCRRLALVNAHTKWLSLTERDRVAQSEWLLRLSMGANGPWRDCLNNAIVRRFYYDTPDSCRVVALYPCLPQNY